MSNRKVFSVVILILISFNISSQTTVDSILQKAESLTNMEEGILFLKNSLKETKDVSQKKYIWLHLGYYKEITGDILSAQYYYQLAAQNNVDSSYKAYLDSAILLQYLGKYNDSEVQLKKILYKTQNAGILAEARIFLTRKYLISGDESFDSSLSKLKQYGESPLAAYFLDRAGIKFIKNFPGENSPEEMLITGKIQLLPDVENVFGLLKGTKYYDQGTPSEVVRENKAANVHYYIQTGSFKDPENAEYLSKDLKKLGFNTFVDKQNVLGTLYYKVLLDAQSQDKVQEIIIKLKDKGYEGYPVY